jgi:hypothetical protein
MPRYLRWIAALTAGFTVQFAVAFAAGAIAVGTDNENLSVGAGLVISFVLVIASGITSLAVNDWLASKYPLPRKGEARVVERSEETTPRV